MRFLISKLNFFIGLSMLLTLGLMTMSMTTSDIVSKTEVANVEVVNSVSIIDYADEEVVNSFSGVACSRWKKVKTSACACYESYANKDRIDYKRTCWLVGMSHISWTQEGYLCRNVCA